MKLFETKIWDQRFLNEIFEIQVLNEIIWDQRFFWDQRFLMKVLRLKDFWDQKILIKVFDIKYF